MKKRNLAEVAKALTNGLGQSLSIQNPRFFTQLLRFLADGRPVSFEQIATALHVTRDDVAAAFQKLPSTEFDHEGNIVGYGLTLIPTSHRFQVSGHQLFTWCAFDTLFFPIILNQPAHVESPCPVTGVNVRLTVTPEGVEHLDPTSAVVSIVIPESSGTCCNVRGTFCNEVHFFSSLEPASLWLKDHPSAIVFPVDDAFRIGRIFTDNLFK